MPLTRYPKKKPEEQMKNCCHLGLSEREIPNKVRAFSAFDINASSATLKHKANVQPKKVCMCELCFPTSDTDKNITYNGSYEYIYKLNVFFCINDKVK